MAIQNQEIDLNLTPSGVMPVVHLKQYDRESRTITCTVYDGSVLFSAPSGASATIRGTKPDHTGFEYSANISGSMVTFTVQTQMTVLAGDVPAEIRITSGSQILGTATIILRVEKAALSSDTDISETELPLIEDQAKKYMNAAASSASAAAASESAAASSASSAASSQKIATDAASRASISESNAKSSESNAETSANQASASQKAASDSATSAAASAVTAAGYAGAAEYSLGFDPVTGLFGVFHNVRES